MGAIVIAGTWRTTAPAQSVWDVMVDLGTWPQWWPAITDVELLGGAPGAPDAARFTFGTPAPLRPLRIEIAVTDRDAPHRMSIRADDGPLVGGGELAVTAVDGTTAASFDLNLRVRSLLFKPVERVLANATRGAGKERLAKAGDDLAHLAGGEPLEHSL